MAVVLPLLPFAGFTQIPEDFEILAEDRAALEEQFDPDTRVLEERTDLLHAPLDLNMATEELLEGSRLFTPFQIHVLLDYREKYGPLYSIYELASLPGFSLPCLEEISGYITTGPAIYEPDQSGSSGATPGRHKFSAGATNQAGTGSSGTSGSGTRLSPSVRPATGNLILFNLGRVFPKSTGYTAGPAAGNDPVYAATPLKFNFRVRAGLKQKLSIGIAYDKDPGEQYFHGMRPEFASGYIHYRATGILRQLVLGSYRLNHGAGLVNGTGFFHSISDFRLNRLSLSELKPYASLNEHNFLSGIAASLKFRKTGCLLWSSLRKLDLSLRDPDAFLDSLPGRISPVDWISFQRTDGLHRIPVELEGRSLGFHHHSGIQVVHQYRNLTIGAMAGMETTGLTGTGKDSLKVRIPPSWHSSFSLHWLWVHPSLEAFGEFVARDLASVALLAGLRVRFSDFLQGLLLMHHYGDSFRGILPASYASGSSTCNEEGISLNLMAEPARRFRAGFSCGLFFYPAPRYLTGVPSTGFRSRCILQGTGMGAFQWKLQLDKNIWQRTPSEDTTGPPPVVTSTRNRVSFQFRYTPVPVLQWQPRIIVSLLSGEGKAHAGYVTYQQVRIQATPALTCTLRFLLFRITDWDNRVYIYEPGLYYSFRFPAFYGEGRKVGSVITFKTGKKITLAGLFSVLTYAERDEIGSGNDLIPGNRKYEAEIQFRIKF
jgi:hypothetical protein